MKRVNEGSRRPRVPPCPDDVRWELVLRIAASPEFQRTARLRDFLLHVSECALRNEPDAATERQVGIHVFGCPPTYDAGNNNIVRAHARLLRLKLESYFSGTGRGEPVIISIPRGTYLPQFQPRTDAHAPERPRSLRFSLRTAILGCIALLLAGAGLALAAAGRIWARQQPDVPHSPPILIQVLKPRPGRHMNVILEDQALLALPALTGRTISLDEYLNRSYLHWTTDPVNPKLTALLHYGLDRALITGSYALPAISRLFESIPPSQVSLKHPRDTTMADFQNDDILLIGGPYVNPWVQLFEERLNFHTAEGSSGSGRFRNRNPSAGEQTEYAADPASGRSYGRIGCLPNLGGNGRVLLLGGRTAEGTKGAIQFASDHAQLQNVLTLFHVRTLAELPPFELLVEVMSKDLTVTSTRIVACRSH